MSNALPRNNGLERDLEIVEAVAALAPMPARNAILSAKTGREKSQISRAVNRLVDTGILLRKDNGVVVGPRLYAMARYSYEAQLVSNARGEMHGLVQKLGETIHLTVLQGLEVITIHSESPSHGFRALSWMGVTAPSYMTSSGRVLLSGLDDDQILRIFPGNKKIVGAPEKCLAKDGASLIKVIQNVRKQGFATVVEEYEPGLVGASVPIYDFSNDVIAALNVAAPKERFENKLEEASKEMQIAAKRISGKLKQER
jgi:DNA-binding IclR family transcriptional regulator